MLLPKTIVTDIRIISAMPVPVLLGKLAGHVRFRSEDSCIWQTDQQKQFYKS